MIDKRGKKVAQSKKTDKVESREHSKVYIALNVDSPSNDLDRFSIAVLKKIFELSIPPTPDNYRIYFEKLLDEKETDFQKKVQELLEFEENNLNENRATIEKEIKGVFASINSVIKVVNNIYKNITLIKQLSFQIKNELQHSDNPIVVKSSIINFNSKLSQFVKTIDTQIKQLQENYKKAGEVFKSVESSTIFDTRFGVYNKRYFIDQVKKEREKIAKYGHKSSIIALQIKDNILKQLPYQKDKLFLLKIISKMLLKTSRRDDVVSFFGNNSFLILLRHTDLEAAKNACKRMHNLLSDSNIILNDSEIEIDACMGISLIDADVGVEECIDCSLKMAEEAKKDNTLYKICEK